MAVPLRATYRVQLGASLGFSALTRHLPYFERLGVSHLYLSPVLQPRTGSTHGYDVVDATRLNPALGTAAEFEGLAAACVHRGMALVLDIVPNHMAASEENRWWADVLERGQDSPYARYFDIRWDEGGGRLIWPVLGQELPAAVAAGELALAHDGGGGIVLRYFDRQFPLAANSAGDGDNLSQVLDRQHYRLIDWRRASGEVNYRRFFDINDLVAMRVEDPGVFAATHRFIGELVRLPGVEGLRVDHVDGLLDPEAYLHRLRDLAGPGCHIWVEKILGAGESLPGSWPVDGTTGYEVQGAIDGLLIDPDGLRLLERGYEQIVGPRQSFPSLVFAAKREVIGDLFPGELARLAGMIEAIVPAVPPGGWEQPLAFLTAAMPRYRTYISAGGVSEEDRRVLQQAAAIAVGHGADQQAITAIVRVLSDAPAEPGHLAFAQRWQQFTGPVAAKGLEDTALYRDRLLLALDAVGRAPVPLSRTSAVAAFHEAMESRAQRWPGGLSTSSTHDSKRSEDVRYRLAVLSQIPGDWNGAVTQWMNDASGLPGEGSLDAETRWAWFQTLLGSWPGLDSMDDAYRKRLVEYEVKAAREAGLHTSWHHPDDGYERTIDAWTRAMLGPTNHEFLRQFEDFAARVTWYAAIDAIAALVLKMTVPGVPDFYQGTEIGELYLVDPDNRRPVDFDRAERALQDVPASPASAGWWRDNLHSPAARLYTISQGLALRREHAGLFATGAHRRLETGGRHAAHIVAFARVLGDRAAVTVVPRLTAALAGHGALPVGPAVWADTWVEAPSGNPLVARLGPARTVVPEAGRLAVSAVLAAAPAEILVSE